MNLTKEKALQIAQAFIKYKYQDSKLGQPRFESHGSKGNNESVDCWVVPIVSILFGLEDTDFLRIEDKTGKIMYLLTGHGRRFVSGEPDAEPEDDGEDWDDI